MSRLIPSSPAYKVSGGRVNPFELPEHPEFFHVPGIQITDHEGNPIPVVLVPGNEHEHYRDFALVRVARIATKLTPWATWYLAPGYTGCDKISHPTIGMAWRESEVTICRTTLAPVHAMATALHEAWHLCELMICDERIRALDLRLADGPAWPGTYYPEAWERRARAFASFGMLIVESPGMADAFAAQVAMGAAPPEIEIYWHVISGAFGKEIMAARQPPPPKHAIVKPIKILEEV